MLIGFGAEGGAGGGGFIGAPSGACHSPPAGLSGVLPRPAARRNRGTQPREAAVMGRRDRAGLPGDAGTAGGRTRPA